MGTFNYKKSNKIITLARKYFDPTNEEIETEMNILNNEFDCNMTFEETRAKMMDDDQLNIEEEYYFIKSDIDSLNLKYYKIECISGYYEGLQLLIDFNISWFENWQEKIEAQKELTKIKKFLIDVVNNFCWCCCCPGWVTGWEDQKDSISKIKQAIKEEREKLKKVETEKNYFKDYNKYYAR